MAMELTGKLEILLNSLMKNTIDLSNATDTVNRKITQAFTNGTGAGKSQIVWHDQGEILTTASVTLDLKALAGGMFGTANFTKVRYFVVQAVTETAGYRLLVSGGAANAFTAFWADASDVEYVPAGGVYAKSSPVDGFVVDATHKTLKIENPSGGTVQYLIWIVGEGAEA
jgi:hypothetical protein